MSYTISTNQANLDRGYNFERNAK